MITSNKWKTMAYKEINDLSDDIHIQDLISQLLNHIDSYLYNTERKKEAFAYIISMWYLASEGRLKDVYTQLSADNIYADLCHADSVLYFKSLRDRYLFFNVEITGRLLDEEKNIAYVMCRLHEKAGKEYYQNLCEYLLHDEKISRYFSTRSQFDMNDGIVLLQFILNWMKPNDRIFNPSLGFFDLPSYIPEDCTFIGGSSDEFRFHLSKLLWAHSPVRHFIYPEEFPETENYKFLIWSDAVSSKSQNGILSSMAIKASIRSHYRKVFTDLLDRMDNHGKAACIISNGFWHYNVYKNAKEHLIESGYIDKIIFLQGNRSILLIDKGKEWNSKIKLVDVHDIPVCIEDLQNCISDRSRNYLLDIERLKEDDYRLDLADALRIKHRPIAKKGMRLVQLKDILTYHPLDYSTSMLVCPQWSKYNPLKNPYIVHANEKGEDLLVINLSNKNEYKPCLFRITENQQPHYNLGETFDVNKDMIDSHYLVNELQKDYFVKQIFPLNLFNYYDSPEDAINMFLSLYILVPDNETSVERQKILYEEEKRERIRKEILSYGYDPDLLAQSRASFLPEGSWLKGHTYQIKSGLSSGGFGKTYRAVWHLQNNKKTIKTQVAIKEFFLNNIQKRDENTLDVLTPLDHAKEISKGIHSFMDEANRIKEFTDSPHIINVYDAFDEHNTCYYVMEYIEGCTLEEYVEQTETRTLKEEEALKIISQVASALDIMHQNHMNHLDVKPSNIMIDEDNDNRAVLIDFGSAHLFREDKTNETSLLLVRSRGFTPPEIQGLKDFSPTVDIYSLGATLYYILVGDTPSATSDQLNEACPDDISDITWHAISKSIRLNPAERPQSISEFMELLNM